MGILQLLAKENYITYHKGLAKQIGVDEAILFGEMCSLTNVYGDEFFCDQEKLMEETCLTEYRVRNAVKTLQEFGLLKVERKGMPAKNYYTLIEDKLIELLDIHRTCCAKFDTTRDCDFDTTDEEKEKSTKKEKDTYIYSNNIREEKKNKEKKENILKEKPHRTRKEFVPPTYEEVLEYAKSRGREDLAKVFFDYYDVGDWKDKNGDKVKIWKQKFITWESNNEKSSTNTPQRSVTSDQSQSDLDEIFGKVMANGSKGNS
jgi:hypothetical protein